MAKISELPDGGLIQSGDLLPIARGSVNCLIKGSNIKAGGLQTARNINLSGVVIGGVSFDGTSDANITTTLATISSGVSNNILIDDGSDLLKKRSANPFIWNTTANPLTGNINVNFIPKASSSTGLTNSLIVETATGLLGVGITPNTEFTVNGEISATENVISTLDIISNRNLSISGNSVLGKDTTTTTTINGIVRFPSASSTPFGLQIGSDVNLYRSSSHVLKTDDQLHIGTLVASTTSNNIVVQENGLIKTRATNPAIWNTGINFSTGSGTANYLPKFTGTGNSIGSSSMHESATNNIGIGGLGSPSAKLTVYGTVSANGDVFANNILLSSLVLTAPGGGLWRLTVTNSGSLSTAPA